METEKQPNELFNSVEFLFAKPCYQGHYMYALDDLESMSIIDKDSLKQLLIQLKCYDFVRTNYLLDRNLPIFFNAKEKRIEEFDLLSCRCFCRERAPIYLHLFLHIFDNSI